MAGTFQSSADFGSGPLTSAGSWDIVATKLSGSGTTLWSKRFGAAGDDLGYAVATDGNGNSVFVGTFQGTVDFGGGPLTAAGSTDMFVLGLAP